MSKKKSVPLVNVIVWAVLVAIVTTALLFGFVFEQPCNGIDQIYFYCRVHPMGFFDWVGLVSVLGGLVYNFILWILMHDTTEDRRWMNWVGMAAVAIGFILMWAL